MKLLTETQRKRMIANARASEAAQERDEVVDHEPVVKLFSPAGAATWLLTELHDDELAFGLCDLGMGFPELGYVSLEELRTTRLPMGLSIERDLHFKADKTLSAYAAEATKAERIVA